MQKSLKLAVGVAINLKIFKWWLYIEVNYLYLVVSLVVGGHTWVDTPPIGFDPVIFKLYPQR